MHSSSSSNLTRMTAISFILFMSRGIMGPVSSLYAESLGANYVVIGLLGTAASLTAILFSTVWGRASDRLRQRRVFLRLGLGVLAVSSGLMALVPNYGYLFPLNVLGAVATAAYSTASLALMGDLLEEQRSGHGRRMGVYRGLGSLGFGLMAFFSGSVADRLSMRAPFYLAALLLAVAFFLALRVEEPAASQPPATFNPHGTLRTRPAAASMPQAARPGRLPLAPLLISAFLWALAIGAVYAVWGNYMVGELGYTRAAMSRLWALASLSEFPLMILAGWLSDRIGRLPMLCLGFLAWAFVFLGYVVVPTMPWIVGIQLVRGFAYSAVVATAMVYTTEVRAKSQRGQASGLYGSAEGAGSILGSTLGGALTQLTNFRTMIATNAALIFGGAIYLAVVALRRALRPQGNPDCQ